MFLTLRTTCLGHGCPQQTGPQTFALKGGPIQHKTERSDAHYTSPPYNLNITFLSTFCHGESQWNYHQHQHGGWASQTTITGHAQHFWLSPSADYTEEANICGPGHCTLYRGKRPTWPGQGRFGHTQTDGHLLPGIMADGYTWWYCQDHPLGSHPLWPPHQNLWGGLCPHCSAVWDFPQG